MKAPSESWFERWTSRPPPTGLILVAALLAGVATYAHSFPFGLVGGMTVGMCALFSIGPVIIIDYLMRLIACAGRTWDETPQPTQW